MHELSLRSHYKDIIRMKNAKKWRETDNVTNER